MAHASDQAQTPSGTDKTQPTKLLPTGRTLSEFKPLSKSEQSLIEACACGKWLHLESEDLKNREIRAELIRFIALGGDKAVPIHESGIMLMGAVIIGDISLNYCNIHTPIALYNCEIGGEIGFKEAKSKNIFLGRSRIKSLNAEGAFIDGDLNLRAIVCDQGQIRVTGASITGDLLMAGSNIANSKESVLLAERVRISGSAFLNNEFQCRGRISFSGAMISGDFSLTNALIECEGEVLVADSMKVGGTVFLRKIRSKGEIRFLGSDLKDIEFCDAELSNLTGNAIILGRAHVRGTVDLRRITATGAINLRGCRVEGELACGGGDFRNPDGVSLNAEEIRVQGAFYWNEGVQAEGDVLLTGATVGSLVDDLQCWRGVRALNLDGFVYDRLAGGSTDAVDRAEWITSQYQTGDANNFRPQPWEQLAKVLRQMGHPEDAKLVAIAKQRQMRKLRIIGSRKSNQSWRQPWRALDRMRVGVLNMASRIAHRLYGALAGYGYRPMRTVFCMMAGWALATAGYAFAEARGMFGPTSPLLQTNPQFADCGPRWERGKQAWTRCDKMPPEHSHFSASFYSLDVILPLVDLKQESDWSPIVEESLTWWSAPGAWVRLLMWVEVLFGWITSLLLVSAVGRLVQKD